MPSRLMTALGLLGLLVPAAVLADPSKEDWYLDFRFEGDGTSRQAVLRLHEDRLSLREQGAQEEVLVTPDAIVVLDHKGRSYTRYTFAQIEATLGAVYASAREAKRARIAELEAVIDSLSADERALVEKEIARLSKETGPDPDRLALADKGSGARIAGLDTRKWVVEERGKPMAEAWITGAIPVLPFKRLLARLAPLVPPGEASLAELLAVLQRLEGFPLRITSAGEEKDLFLVLEAKAQDFSDKDFEPPTDYKKSSPSIKGGW